MREISASAITLAVARLCVEANQELPASLEALIRAGAQRETSPTGRPVMEDLARNLDAARSMAVPICQDTGMAVVFAQVGQEVHINGNFEEAVNAGVRQGYVEGLLRCSVVADPLRRTNTGDNTPAILHTRLVPGDRLKLTVAPKGFGSENMSRLRMFTPAASEEEIIVLKRPGAIPARRWCWGWALAATLNCAPSWPKPLCAGTWASGTRTPSTRTWRPGCSRRSTRPAWGPRALAGS